MTVVGVCCTFRVVEVEWEDRAVETVDVVFVSLRVAWSGGVIESMNSAGESEEVGVTRRERGRSVTEPREDCGVFAVVGEGVLLVMVVGLLVSAVRVEW